MATARLVINTALRKIGRLGAGREPRLADQTDTLEALRSLYRGWIASGAFGRLRDILPKGTEYTAGENERIFRTDDGALSVTLPELVPNWPLWWPYRYGDMWVPPVVNATNQDKRPPRNGAVVVLVDAFSGSDLTWIYDGNIRKWTQLDEIELDDEAPLSSDQDGLSACLAMAVADQFGADPTAMTQAAAKRYTQAMTANYSFPRRVSAGVYF